MLSQIVIYNNIEKFNQYINQLCSDLKIKNPGPDLQIDQSDNINIDQLKSWFEFLKTKPYSGQYKSLVIEDANTISQVSQNRLLKIIEEPPTNCLIILGCLNSILLLDTIVSRAQIINQLESSKQGYAQIEEFLNLDLVHKFEFIDKYEDKHQLLTQIQAYLLEQNQQKPNLRLTDAINTAQIMTKSNVSIRPILEHIALMLDKENQGSLD